MNRLWVAVAVALGGCSTGVEAAAGAGEPLQIAGATLHRERPEGERDSTPTVRAAYLTRNFVEPGETSRSFSGVLDAEATGAAIALDDEPSYWVVTAGAPFPEAPGLPTFSATLSFADDVAPGPHELVVWASDEAGHVGPEVRVAFTVVEPAAASATLMFTLTWDSAADLDLQVRTPQGRLISQDETNSWEPSDGDGGDGAGWQSGGRLTNDAFAGCDSAGRAREAVTWTQPPPAGAYAVMVVTESLCGAPSANYRVEAWFRGELLERAAGTALSSSTRPAEGGPAALQVLEVVVP